MRRVLCITGFVAIFVAATPATRGGWAVVTFLEVPEYLEAGKPTTFSFKVRQHGTSLRSDLSPTLELRDQDAGWFSRLFTRHEVAATLVEHGGFYEATLTPAESGQFSLVVDTDIFGWKTKTLPLTVVPQQEVAAPLTPYHRGQQLFVAKGCATCHAKFDDPDLEDIRLIQVGPALTDRVFDGEWLTLKLADPSSYQMTVVPGVEMPDLELQESEVAALVQYINGESGTIVTAR